VIVIAYDGSADAQAAIDRTGELLNGQPATVLTVWERFIDIVTRSGAGMPIGEIDYESLDQGYAESARQRAREGLERAERAGLKAQAHTRAREQSIASTILAEAEALDAAAIVLGTRGLTGLKSLLLGSVSHGVVQHASVPVIVVPSSETAARRAERGL
jgi:nucleotide-binding universal stress UspA family protein